ncbi:MAG: glycosyltransferase family A protein [Campylobacterota bacterium]|nr:glycosyltransferase family A protein [Campylobacterota bacterium]
MKISVIIPTYNRAGFLKKTIQSILNQTYKVNEIIIVDDGSTDTTKDILKQFENNIIYIYQNNSGVSSARNKGLKYAKNDWICFLDSDDIWEKSKIEKQVYFHKNNKKIYISHTDELWLFNDKIIKQNKQQQKPSGFCFEENIPLCKIGASTVMINKKVFDDIGLFDENLIACEDYDLWLRVLLKYELGYIDEKLIQKIAGHKGQLSFQTPLIDKYRIEALLKHTNTKYQDKIKEEIIKKSDILIKGAKKHNNITTQIYYLNLKSDIINSWKIK